MNVRHESDRFKALKDARHIFGKMFHQSGLRIGVRLTACFLTIVVLMIGADAVAIWQLREMAAHTEMLNTADKASAAIVRVHLDVNSFSREVARLTRSRDTNQFAKEAALLRETFLQHVRDAEQILASSPEIAQDAFISSALKTLKPTLPSQIDAEIELANAGDWAAIQLRLTGQIQDLLDLSSSLVEGVEERVFLRRTKVNQETERVRHRLFIIVPVAWVLSLFAAAILGWYVTGTIIVPLSKLTTAAQALARGDFGHEVSVGGSDELTVLGNAFNHAARQLHNQFEMTLEVRVAERTRIARELHDTLLQSFHGVLLRLQTVSQLLRERPEEAQDELDNTIEQVAEAITEGRNAVQGLREFTVQSSDLALAISTFGEELTTRSENGRPLFHLAVEGEFRDLLPMVRDEIYGIAAEALRNTFRHAEAQRVEVEIRYDQEQFRLRVRDDGKGLDPAILSGRGRERHYGLPGMQERAKLIGAKLTVWSKVGSGTEIEVCLPASAAYGTAQRRS